MKTTTVRIEWGAMVVYLEHRSHMPRVDCSGTLRIKAGKIIGKEQYRLERIGFGPGREVRWKMKDNRWQSRPANEIEGLLIEVVPTAETAFSLQFEWGEVSFTLAELRKGSILHWPVGPNYRFLSVRASLADVDPLEMGFADDPLPEACPPKPDVLITAEDFKGARCFLPYFRRTPAWIGQFGSASAEFRISRPRKMHLRLYMMLGLAYAEAMAVNRGVNRLMPLEPLLNGRSLGRREWFFSCTRGNQFVEEIAFEVPSRLLRKGRNRVTIRNHDHCYHLLVIKAELRAKPLNDDFAAVTLPQGYCSGYDINPIARENRDEFDALLGRFGPNALGNYALLRLEGSHICAEDIDRYIEILKNNGVRFAYMWDETSYTRQIQDKAGALFAGQMFHEISAGRRRYSRRHIRRYPRPTMRTACEQYIAYIRRMVQSVKRASGGRTNAIVGEDHQYAALDYIGGMDTVLSEVNVGHVGLLLAEARGAYRSFGTDIFGVHVPGGSIKFPALLDLERLYQTTLHTCYLHGVRLVYDEESALTMVHGKTYSYHSRLCRGRRAMLARYSRFVSKHGCPGDSIVPLAVMRGRFESPFPTIGGKAWTGFGGRDETWTDADPEAGWALIDVLLPGVWRPSHKQDWRKIRFWHAGTPFGQFDIICSESPGDALRRYKSIIMPGWNSMDGRLYRKLVSYVTGGGKLFMALPQLSRRVDREFARDTSDLRLIKNGDLSELFGARIGPGAFETSAVSFEGGSGLLPEGKMSRLRRPLGSASVEPVGADVLARDPSGRPVLVEKRVGKGIARLLTLREFPGAMAARGLMRAIWKALAVEARGRIWVEDPTGEVAWYLFDNHGQRQLWLHNTDWVTAGNHKDVKVHSGDRVIDVTVEQGQPLRLEIESLVP